MELRQQCELIEVKYASNDKKAILTFLDDELGEVLEVNFNKQKFDQDKREFVDDVEKAEQVDKWCEEEFGTTFDKLTQKLGVKKDIYHYDNFNSLWETNTVATFKSDNVGEIYTANITDVNDNGNAICIFLDVEGTIYRSKMNYGKYIEARKEYLVDPVKKTKQYAKFKTKFGVDFSQAESIVGKSVMIEVKEAFGEFVYIEIKKPKWSK